MENEVYERDYSANRAEINPAEQKQLKFMGALLHDIEIQQPRMISPEGKSVYDYLLQQCDTYCKFYCGKIRAIIDFQNWDARITLTLPTLCCCLLEQKEFFLDILLHTKSVSFLPAADGQAVQVEIRIEYFETLTCDSEEEDLAALIGRMKAAAEKMCKGDPAIMEKIQEIFEEYEQDQTE